MKVFFYSEKGFRKKNDDSLLLNSLLINNKDMTIPKSFIKLNKNTNKFFVSDGMGGYSNGEIASKIILETFKGIRSKFDELNIKKSLDNAINDMINFSSKNIIKVMGATISGVFLSKNNNVAFNVGDTRIYKISNKKIEMLSTDHSLAFQLYEDGFINKDMIRHHSSKNILTSSISNNKDIKFSLNFTTFSFNDDDILLICSDGVWEQFDEKSILKNFISHGSFESSIGKFYKMVKRNPQDNISFIAIKK